MNAAGVLIFVLLELIVFSAVINVSSNPKCHLMDDCPTENYCKAWEGMAGLPICTDCSWAPLYFPYLAPLYEEYYGDDNIEDDTVDDYNDAPLAIRSNNENTKTPTKAPQVDNDDNDNYFSTIHDKTCSALFAPKIWENRAYVLDYALDVDYNELPLGKEFDWSRDEDKYGYLANHQCSQTDMDAQNDYETKHCDFITHNREKMDVQIWILFFVLSVLWTLPICQDIEEAVIKEIKVVRVILRIQRFVVPLMATSSTIVLRITNELLSKSIFLIS